MSKNLRILCTLVLFTMGYMIHAQVSGTITDAEGKAITAASVRIIETGVEEFTDANGKFTINAQNGQNLEVNALGMEVQRITISGNTANFSLKKGEALSEVVVTGTYGIRKTPSQEVGAINTVNSEAFEKPSGTTLEQSLEGRISGVNIVSGSGQPGSAISVIIRGLQSLTSGTTPLYVIDGIPVISGDQTGLLATANALSSINQFDIDNVEVLKDGAATALYGSRGANGVILVTTKKGKKGKNLFSFSSEFGYSKEAYEKFEYLNAQGHVDVTANGLLNHPTFGYSDYATAYVDAVDYLGWDETSNFDWKKATRNNNPGTQRYNLSYQGGNQRTLLYASLGYTDQDGISRDARFNRLSGTLNAEWKANDKLKLFFNLTASRAKQSGPADASAFANPIFSGRLLSPTQPIYNPDGSYNLDLAYLNPTFNVVGLQDVNKLDGNFYKLLTSLGVDYQFLPYLRFTSNAGADFNYIEELQYWNPDFGDGFNDGKNPNGDGYGFKRDRNLITWNWNNFLHFYKTFASKHEIAISAGIETAQYTRRRTFASAQGYPSGRYDLFELNNAANTITASSDSRQWSLYGMLGTASYTFNKIFTLAGTFRRDGYSGFGDRDRFGNFYSGGASINLHKFFTLKHVNQLKLRASYGENGSTAGYFYESLPTYTLENSYSGISAGSIDKPGNPELQWEVSKKLNLGLDFELFKGRLYGTFDWYKNKNSEQLLEAANGGSTGFSKLDQNIGDSESTGLEASLGGYIVRSNNFSWNMLGNYSYNESEVLKLSGVKTEQAISGNKRLGIGHNPSEFYTRLWAGVDPANGDPLWYTDASKSATTNNVNDAKQAFTGKKALPTHIASLANTFNYKGFQLSLLFTYKGDYSVWDKWAIMYDNEGDNPSTNHLSTALTDTWSTTNTTATRPKYIFGGNKSSNASSTRYIYEADNIRLRNIEIGYKFSGEILNLDLIKGLYVYFRGTNLKTWVFDDNLKFDPESLSNVYGTNLEGLGVYDQTQPILKAYLFGFRIDF